MNALTAERLRALLDYDPETGDFTWRCHSGGRSTHGRPAGGMSGEYIRIAVLGRRYQAHRLAWLHYYGAWPAGDLDHINNVKTDNRIVNLRDATPGENLQNQRRAHSQNKTGLLGVSLTKGGRYAAMIQLNGECRYLGSYATPDESHAAYLQAKGDIHPFGTLDRANADSTKLERKKGTGNPGIWVRRGRFRAYFKSGDKQVCVGTFDTLAEAVEARERAIELSRSGRKE